MGDGTQRAARIRAWVALGLWVALILLASGNAFSLAQTDRLARHLRPEGVSQSRLVLLRALIHVIEYGVLGALAFRAWRLQRPRATTPLGAVGFAILLCLAVSGTDEHHQAGEPDRTGSPRDVALDTAGGMFGALVASGFDRRRRPGQAGGA